MIVTIVGSCFFLNADNLISISKKKFFFEILLVHKIQKSTNGNFLIKKKNLG